MLNVVSSAQFVPNDSHTLVSRDLLCVKLWDLRVSGSSGMIVDSGNQKPVMPVYAAQVTDYTEKNLTNLMELNHSDDRFFLDVSPDGQHVATGAYNKSGHVMDIRATTNTAIICKFDELQG